MIMVMPVDARAVVKSVVRSLRTSSLLPNTLSTGPRRKRLFQDRANVSTRQCETCVHVRVDERLAVKCAELNLKIVIIFFKSPGVPAVVCQKKKKKQNKGRFSLNIAAEIFFW